jgi:hypothetical protein
MPSKLDAPVLTVDVGLIHKVDTRNVENLFSMWTGEPQITANRCDITHMLTLVQFSPDVLDH